MIVVIILIAMALYYTIGRNYQSLILVVLSLYVYWGLASWNVVFIGGLGVCVALCSMLLSHTQNKLFVAVPILLLGCGFFILKSQYSGLTLPLGYSVIAFTSISLLVDQYKSPRQYSFLDCLSFLLFFPKIFAGPIERANHFIRNEKKSFEVNIIYSGIKYLIFAAFCKLVIGDYFTAVDMQGEGVNLWFHVLCYSLNFFFDFWAYSLMAIGLGKLFGYDLAISFYKPYYSISFREFWHRWNITLGTWLRDYVYISLGGNRNKTLKWMAVVFLVFLVSGVWHGTMPPFILWGIIHACLLIIEHFAIKSDMNRITRFFYSVGIFVIVSFLWQLFIIDDIEIIPVIVTNLFTYSSLQWSCMARFLIGGISMIILTSNYIFSLVETNSHTRKRIIAEVSLLSLMLVALLIFNCPINFNFFYFRF